MADLAKIANIIPKTIKYFTSLSKDISKFIKKAVPIAPMVILSFFLMFFGIQMLVGFISGTPGMIPHIPLLIFSTFGVYNIVLSNNRDLKNIQNASLKGIILLLNNQTIKKYIGFNVKVDPKNPLKSSINVIKWIGKNIFKIFGIILIALIALRIIVQKIYNKIIEF